MTRSSVTRVPTAARLIARTVFLLLSLNCTPVAAGPDGDGRAVGMAKGAASMCPGIKWTSKLAELERQWRATDRQPSPAFEMQFALAGEGFLCRNKIKGISCADQNIARCGKTIQLYGPNGWRVPGLVTVGKPSPFANDMPPPGPAAKILTASDQLHEDKSAGDENLERDISKFLGSATNPKDLMHGTARVKPRPYNEILIDYTVYQPATPSEIITIAADAAHKVGKFSVTQKRDLKGKRVRIQMAILANPTGAPIGAFVATWSADSVLKAADDPAGVAALIASVSLEEIYGSYWPALCSNLPRPEQFLDGGDEAEHPLDVENPQNRDLSCKRRTDRQIRVGG
jgi:hypothetical protein